MKKKTLIALVCALFAIFLLPKLFVDFLEWKGKQAGLKRAIENIHSEFRGIIVEKYTVRNKVPPTHLKVLTKDTFIEITPYSLVVRYAEIGDSVIKLKDENIILIIKPDSSSFKHYYKRIPKSYRESSDFPTEWRDKWLDSSTFDTLND